MPRAIRLRLIYCELGQLPRLHSSKLLQHRSKLRLRAVLVASHQTEQRKHKNLTFMATFANPGVYVFGDVGTPDIAQTIVLVT